MGWVSPDLNTARFSISKLIFAKNHETFPLLFFCSFCRRQSHIGQFDNNLRMDTFAGPVLTILFLLEKKNMYMACKLPLNGWLLDFQISDQEGSTLLKKSPETPLESKGCTGVTFGPRDASQGVCPLQTKGSLMYFPWFQGKLPLEMHPLALRLLRCIPCFQGGFPDFWIPVLTLTMKGTFLARYGSKNGAVLSQKWHGLGLLWVHYGVS